MPFWLEKKIGTRSRKRCFLLSIPGMRESIREGLATPVEECEKEPGW